MESDLAPLGLTWATTSARALVGGRDSDFGVRPGDGAPTLAQRGYPCSLVSGPRVGRGVPARPGSPRDVSCDDAKGPTTRRCSDTSRACATDSSRDHRIGHASAKLRTCEQPLACRETALPDGFARTPPNAHKTRPTSRGGSSMRSTTVGVLPQRFAGPSVIVSREQSPHRRQQ